MTCKTCGPLFHEVLTQAAPLAASYEGTPSIFWFSLGHMTGQAEKVYMGACPAFMMRPGADEMDNLIKRVRIICRVYGLYWDRLETRRGIEVWVGNIKTLDHLSTLRALRVHGEEDSGAWHFIRGGLCGIPVSSIDARFHQRYS